MHQGYYKQFIIFKGGPLATYLDKVSCQSFKQVYHWYKDIFREFNLLLESWLHPLAGEVDSPSHLSQLDRHIHSNPGDVIQWTSIG